MFWFLCFLSFIPNAIAVCPFWSVSWSSTCYFFMSTPQNFSQAESVCNNLQGNLASIHDSFTNAFIYNQANRMFSSGFYDFSIGLSCISGNCSWNDGSPFDYNDFPSYYSTNQTGCVAMDLSNGYWFIEGCSDKRFYVCGRPETLPTTTPILITSSTPTSLCPSNDWVYFNETNSCYYWTSSSDWATAEAFCVSQNAHLASIHSSTEMDFLKFFYNGNIWVGLRTNKGPIQLNTEWQWTDGSPLDYLPWKGYYYSMPNMGKDYQCVYSQDGISNDNCSQVNTGMCKKPSSQTLSTTGSPPVIKCLPGWTYFKGTDSCYTGPSSNLTQNSAELYCQSIGGHLPSIRMNDELRFLLFATSFLNFWIGLYTTDSLVQLNTTWHWTDTTPVNYIRWFNGVPSLDNKQCGTTASDYTGSYSYSTNYGFQNADCSASFMTICKQPSLDTVPTSSPAYTVKPPSPCDNIWTNSSYFIPLAMMNWTTSEEYCELCGGYLASFHSYDELYTTAKNIYNNGLYSDNNGRTWEWNDSSPYNYSYWYRYNPDQNGAACANLYLGNMDYSGQYGMANDQNCSTSLYGICKYKNR
uniref:C-type lectin domain-containing protein n=1 Tax=Panagrolaimus davidi TaxID=227884 RepID=A0A914R875_9BILA